MSYPPPKYDEDTTSTISLDLTKNYEKIYLPILIGTLISIGHKLSKNDDSKEVDRTTYISMIGKLQYVVHTRLDIALAIGMVARFSTNPKENHMMAIKII